MADHRIEDVWNAAVDRYKERTGHTLADAWPDMPERFNLAALLAHVDEDNGKYAKYKERRKSLHEALNPVLHIVETLAETAGETGALFFPPSKAICVAVCWLLAAGRNYGDRYDTIIEVFTYLKQTLGRVKIHSAHVMTAELRASMVDTLGHVLVLVGTARKALEGGRLKQLWRVAGRKADELKESMNKLKTLTAQENSVVSAETLSAVNTLFDRLNQGMGAKLYDSLYDLSVSIQAVRDEGFSAWLRSWLNPPDASYNHERHLRSREDKTGLWFLQGSQFVEWQDVSDSFLWIQGPPGCGKSVLCSSAIDAVAKFSSSTPCIYLYFYFDFNDKTKQTYDGLLSWILLQLAGCFETVPPPLAQLRTSSRNGAQRPNHNELFKVIRELCSLFSDLYLMLDALDECSSRELGSVLDLLDNLRKDDTFSLHALVTSRPEPAIVNRFKQRENDSPVTVVLAEDIVQHDIEIHIQERVTKDSQLNCHGQEVCDTIQRHLCDNAKGMFRWVSLQLDHLGTYRTPAKVKKALKGLPPTLVATYSHILRSIVADDVPYVAMMLPYLIYSQRLLTLDELAAAAAVELDSDDPLDPENRFSDPKEVLKLCPGLVTLFRYPESHDDKTTYVQLAHFSVQEYLVSDAAREYADHFNLMPETAHYVIYRTSLHVLNCLDEPNMPKTAIVPRQPLGRHAAQFWPYHLRLSSCAVQSDSDAWAQLRRLFDHTKPYLVNWIRCYNHDAYVFEFSSGSLHTAADSLYYASLLGVYDVCVSLLNEGVAVNAEAKRSFVFALEAACHSGHIEVVRLLLDLGANINIPCGVNGSALQLACTSGHIELARLLLDRGADINIPCGDYEFDEDYESDKSYDSDEDCEIEESYSSALASACHGGHVEVARLLLDRGANINTPSGYHLSALGAACIGSHVKLARLLLDCGADINTPDVSFGSALGAACHMGHLELTQLLIDSGANINITGGKYGSALGAACYGGHVEPVRRLLDRGADVNILGGHYGSALGAACHEGHFELVQLLLDHGADINITGGEYGLALGAACHGGHFELAQMLLDHGADINIPGGDCAPALEAACHRGHVEFARLLLDRGADINITGGKYGSALGAACHGGHFELARMLLDLGSAINIPGGSCGTALGAACHKGNLEFARLLLGRGADINMPGGEYGSALGAACSEGHDELARLLLDRGADINIPGGDLGSALGTACFRGHFGLARLLLDRGADINIPCGDNGSALAVACSGGRFELARLLLDRGADVNIRGGRFGSALGAACSWGHVEFARLLLDRGADVNIPGGESGSALMEACYAGHVELVRLLVDRGADTNTLCGRYGFMLQAESSGEAHIL